MKCPKCAEAMTEGCLTDRMRPSFIVANWMDGPREEGVYGLETAGRKIWKVDGFRCETCGYLELFACKRDYSG